MKLSARTSRSPAPTRGAAGSVLVSVVAVAAIAMLVAPGLALGRPAAPVSHVRSLSPGRLAARSMLAAPSFALSPSVPLALSGGGTVTGVAETYDGTALANVEVDLYAYVSPNWEPDGSAVTAGDGSFTVNDVAAAAQGAAVVAPDDAFGDSYAVSSLSFADPGPTDVGALQPGGISVQAASDGPWAGSTLPWIDTYNLDQGWAGTTFDTSASWPSGFRADAAPGKVSNVVFYFYSNEAAEWIAPSGDELSVSSGATNGTTLSFDESQALRTWIQSPWIPSGKAGAKVTLAINNWPAGYTATIQGHSDGPVATWKTLGSLTSSGTTTFFKTVTVPTSATPGYDYVLVPSRTDSSSALSLYEYYQVCSFKAAKSVIAKGSLVKLSGIIPTAKATGAKPGPRKTIWIYAATKAKPQPTTWTPAKKYWELVAKTTANGLGKFARSLRLQRTTWLVARYPADNWFFGGFTSVIKVKAR